MGLEYFVGKYQLFLKFPCFAEFPVFLLLLLIFEVTLGNHSVYRMIA